VGRDKKVADHRIVQDSLVDLLDRERLLRQLRLHLNRHSVRISKITSLSEPSEVAGTIHCELPLYVVIGVKKPKKISLTLNWYRNAHFHVSNSVKANYSPIDLMPFHASKISIDYTLVLSSKKRTDAQNWISVADKFFLDWLVQNGMIHDDDFSVYSSGSWKVITDSSWNINRLYATIKYS